MSACKSCGASIIWATANVENKKIPLDAQTVIGGNITLEGLIATVGAAGSGPYQSHFVSCPDATKHRRKKAGPIHG